MCLWKRREARVFGAEKVRGRPSEMRLKKEEV
jgi:hypothetical protein